MKNRNKIIAIFFVVFILVIPAVTFVRGFTTKSGQTGLTAEQQAILEGNGTLQNTDENEGESQAEVIEEDFESEYVQDLNFFDGFAYRFCRLKDDLTQFTNRLFLKTKFVAFNAKLTSFFTNGEYVESNIALAGKDGWMFFKDVNDGNPVYNYMGVDRYNDEQLADGAANVVRIRNELAERGIDFFAVCFPNKEMVYSEYMPDTIVQVYEETKGMQFINYLKANTDIKCSYPKDAMLEAKKDRVIYFKTDTHWNQQGAFIGFNEIIKTNYGVSDDINKIEFEYIPEAYVGDIVDRAGLADKYPLNDQYRFVESSANPDLYRDEVCMIVGDSFGGFLSTVAKAYYKDVHWIYMQDFKWAMIDEYQPDIVIMETVERYTDRFMNYRLNEMY